MSGPSRRRWRRGRTDSSAGDAGNRYREGEYGNPTSESPATADGSPHIPVLVNASVDALCLERLPETCVVIDATLGGGGHARAFLARLSERAKLIGIERDRRMIENLALADPRMTVVEGNFREPARILKSLGHDAAHAIFADVGLSTRHYQTPEWGFSFRDGPLDMRLDDRGPTAADIVNGWSETELADWLLGAGERLGRKIARGLVDARKKEAITRTSQLAAVVSDTVGHSGGRESHPATKTFRAIREAVTGEMKDLEAFIADAAGVLTPGGRLAVLTYTWEEQRLVRHEADRLVKGCVCPPRLPVCMCKQAQTLKWVERKGIRPTCEEVRANRAARSAVLLVMERV